MHETRCQEGAFGYKLASGCKGSCRDLGRGECPLVVMCLVRLHGLIKPRTLSTLVRREPPPCSRLLFNRRPKSYRGSLTINAPLASLPHDQTYIVVIIVQFKFRQSLYVLAIY